MPVPDHVVFGPAPDESELLPNGLKKQSKELGQYLYGDIRRLGDEHRIEALELRMSKWIVEQIGKIPSSAPFPVALMTCVALEAYGTVFYGRKYNKHSDDKPRLCFIEMSSSIDKRFSRSLPKDFKQCFLQRWPERKSNAPKTLSEILFVFFRNSMTHGYWAKGVYLSGDVAEYELKDGYVSLDPFWFWDVTKLKLASSFSDMRKNSEQNNPLRLSSLDFVNSMIAGASSLSELSPESQNLSS